MSFTLGWEAGTSLGSKQTYAIAILTRQNILLSKQGPPNPVPRHGPERTVGIETRRVTDPWKISHVDQQIFRAHVPSDGWFSPFGIFDPAPSVTSGFGVS